MKSLNLMCILHLRNFSHSDQPFQVFNCHTWRAASIVGSVALSFPLPVSSSWTLRCFSEGRRGSKKGDLCPVCRAFWGTLNSYCFVRNTKLLKYPLLLHQGAPGPALPWYCQHIWDRWEGVHPRTFSWVWRSLASAFCFLPETRDA